MWLRTKLEAIELILSTAEYTKADVKYWMKERSLALKELLKKQLENFG